MSYDQNEAQRSLLDDPNQINVTHGNLLAGQMAKAIPIHSGIPQCDGDYEQCMAAAHSIEYYL